MNKEDYVSKMQQVLRDGKCTTLRRDPTVRTERKIAEHLKSLQDDGHIDDRLCDRLIPRYSNPPRPPDVWFTKDTQRGMSME